jgi:prevent-host-death family protein
MWGMSSIGIYEAKKHFSKLLRRAAAGEEIVITRSGDPVVRLVAIELQRGRQLGIDAGVFDIPDDFDDVHVPDVGKASQS